MTPKNASHAMIDQFKLDALIGRGGMGDIWRATHTVEGSQVAIKLMRSELARSTQARELFKREAEVMQQLKNPHVVQVYQYAVTAERTPYMVMELLRGYNLRERLEQSEPISLLDALQIMTQVLKALSEAHQLGIIHRDIKPSNIFLQRSEFPSHELPSLHTQSRDSQRGPVHAKIMDFGLATQHTHTHLKTHPRELVGTYLFMAPEQANREKITPRADIYSVGATLYTLLAKRPPRVPTGADAPMSHFNQPAPDLSEEMPHLKVPRKLSQLIKRCLAIEPRERPDNADVVRRALEQITHQVMRGFSREIDEFSLSPHDPPPRLSSQLSMHDEGLGAGRDELSPSSLNLSSLNLSSLIQRRHQDLVEKWAQKIADRPGRSSIKTHHLKTYLKITLEQLSGISLGRDSSLYHDQLLPLTQMSFSDPPLELLPLITLSLLRQIITQELAELDIEKAPICSAFDLSVFKLRQRFIEITVNSQHYESGNGLYRLFSSGSETPILCTLSGVAINTHPKLRTALIHDENASLTGRKIFDILRGFQPIHTLYESLRRAHEYPPHTHYELKNESSTGRAEQLIIHPHLINYNQKQLLVIIDVTAERHMTEFIPALDHFEPELGSPQSLPWNQTVEVQALRPEEMTRRPPKHNEGYPLNREDLHHGSTSHGGQGSAQPDLRSDLISGSTPSGQTRDPASSPHVHLHHPSSPHTPIPQSPNPQPSALYDPPPHVVSPHSAPSHGYSTELYEGSQTVAYGGSTPVAPHHHSDHTTARPKTNVAHPKVEPHLKRGDWGEPQASYQTPQVTHEQGGQRVGHHAKPHLNPTISRPPTHHKSAPPLAFIRALNRTLT